MSIWFFIWLCLTAIILYFVIWNLVILFRQKQTWKNFAQANTLRYTAGKFGESPKIDGVYQDLTLSMFTGEHETPSARGTRKLAAVEINLKTKLPYNAGLATQGMVPFLKNVRLGQELSIDHKGFPANLIVTATEPEQFKDYLTPQRLDALLALAKIKNAWVILVFQDDISLLRFDTPDPLDSERKIKAILKKMKHAADILAT